MNDDTPPKQKQGFVKLMRSSFTIELLRDPLAFVLLTAIAFRARRREGGFDGLQVGEALIGDHDSYGLTRQQYRSRCAKLEKLGLVAFRKTNRGTIAKLMSIEVFDINEAAPESPKNQPAKQPPTFTAENSADQPSTNHQSTSQQPLTKKERMKERKKAEARMEKELSSSTYSNSLAEEHRALIDRSTSSPSEPHIVVTPAGERFNQETEEYEF